MTKKGWLGSQVVRAAAILTGSYVASSQQRIQDFNQIFLYVDFTIGSLTSAELKIEFSEDGSNWYQEVSQVSAGGGTFTQNPVVHKFTATGKKRIPVPVADIYVRVSCKGTGTVTSSSMAVKLQLGSS